MFESSFSVISQLQTEIQGGIDIWIIHKFSGNLFLILKKLMGIIEKSENIRKKMQKKL